MLVVIGESSLQGFLAGAGFRPSTVSCRRRTFTRVTRVLRVGSSSLQKVFRITRHASRTCKQILWSCFAAQNGRGSLKFSFRSIASLSADLKRTTLLTRIAFQAPKRQQCQRSRVRGRKRMRLGPRKPPRANLKTTTSACQNLQVRDGMAGTH